VTAETTTTAIATTATATATTATATATATTATATERPTTLPVDVAGMTVIALLSVAPVVEGGMADEVAKAVAALDDFDVAYETNPMGTVIEADDVDTLLAAVAAAHKAVDADRVSTFLKIDDKRTVDQRAAEKVADVEAVLGRPAKRDRD
jgi:uncharacterized protein (TIGR00106 family)